MGRGQLSCSGPCLAITGGREKLSAVPGVSCLVCHAEGKEMQKATPISTGHEGGWDGLSPSCRICCSTSPCFQAFLIAFTSDFLPHAYYRYIH